MNEYHNYYKYVLIKKETRKKSLSSHFDTVCLLQKTFACVRAIVCVFVFPPTRRSCPAVRQTCSPMTYLSAALWEQRLFFESEQQIKILISSAGLQRASAAVWESTVM